MAITEAYLSSGKNVKPFFDALVNAQPPPKVTTKFVENLGFKSTNDRLFINLLKGLGFIDANGAPQERYFRFIDQTQSKAVLAEGIKEAYSDLFALNIKANEMPQNDVKNKLKTILQGGKADNIIARMASTFKGLCEYADFSKSQLIKVEEAKSTAKDSQFENPFDKQENGFNRPSELISKSITTELHYNIQIHLPETRDIAVYDAIFESLRKHLL